MASIRELVPRLYSEMSILQCYRLLMPEEDIKNIIVRMGRCTAPRLPLPLAGPAPRLSAPASLATLLHWLCCRMTRGIGDPLVACYARSYLVHKALQASRLLSLAIER